MAEALLVLAHVTVRFGALRAVDDVSLGVPKGERRAVIGPNGAGKTTLFNAISGVLRPTEGRVVFAARDLTRAAPDSRARAGIGRTFQITNLFTSLSVEDNIRLAVRGLSRRKFSLFGRSALDAAESEKAERALAMARLGERRGVPVKELSYGEQRQLEVAMALANAPRLLLLDEPAAGLSPAERGGVAEIIRALPRDLTMVLIEHDMDLALGLVDRVTCLHNGRVIADEPPDSIRRNAAVQEVYLGKPRHA
jgi:branched-chain amino acid transport system ATP-binding protein